ncbi:hypothetical protein VTO42DRAFT_1723 [Malbranchea cinnamomea]
MVARTPVSGCVGCVRSRGKNARITFVAPKTLVTNSGRISSIAPLNRLLLSSFSSIPTSSCRRCSRLPPSLFHRPSSCRDAREVCLASKDLWAGVCRELGRQSVRRLSQSDRQNSRQDQIHDTACDAVHE